MKFMSIKIIVIVIFLLSGCSSEKSLIRVYNNLPKAKVILEKDPDETRLYDANYTSLAQDIYNNNVKIILLDMGVNDIYLDETHENYGIYFILPGKRSNDNLNSWKYIVSGDEYTKFTINEQENIEKDE
jgi:hypothetical protein